MSVSLLQFLTTDRIVPPTLFFGVSRFAGRVQLARVKELLSESDLPLKSIAGLTGFEHIEYLSVVFKRMTGESPGQYRKRTRPRQPAA